MGLGLAIVRHLVELHGGTAFAKSAGPGKGAQFVMKCRAPRGIGLRKAPCGRTRCEPNRHCRRPRHVEMNFLVPVRGYEKGCSPRTWNLWEWPRDPEVQTKEHKLLRRRLQADS